MQTVYEHFHDMFAVNLLVYWGVLVIYQVLLLSLIVVVQKRKDVI